jgi:hypothetical protein
MDNKTMNVDKSRRDFIRKASYAAPALMTLSVMPAHASYGSGHGGQTNASDGSDGDRKVRNWDDSAYWERRRSWLISFLRRWLNG